MQVDENADQMLNDVDSLKACVNDLISLLALPAIWSGGEPRQIVGSLIDVLLGMLRLDFACALIGDAEEDPPQTIIKLAKSGDSSLTPETLRRELTPWLSEHSHPSPPVLKLLDGNDFLLAPIRFGLKQDLGLIVAGSRRKGFPNPTEKLLLSVAANQAAISLQDARILEQQREIARRLDRTVVQTQAQLSRAARVATAAQLSASIAHEVNQPLAAIVNNSNAVLNWLVADPPNTGKIREVMETIVRDSKGAAEVVHRVRKLFSGSAPERIPFQVNELIRETAGVLQFEANTKEVTLETELECDLPFVMAERVQVQQVILNLLINAIEATEDIQDRAKRVIARSKLQLPYVLIEIEDHGIGIDDPERIFESFFTTKVDGMGLGLAISRSMVEVNEGRLWVESKVGSGSSFYFTIPVDSSFAE